MAPKKRKKGKRTRELSAAEILRSINDFDAENVASLNLESVQALHQMQKSWDRMSEEQVEILDKMVTELGTIPHTIQQMREQEKGMFTTLTRLIISLEADAKKTADPKKKQEIEGRIQEARGMAQKFAMPATHPKNVTEAVGLKYFGLHPQYTRKKGLLGAIGSGIGEMRDVLLKGGHVEETILKRELEEKRIAEEHEQAAKEARKNILGPERLMNKEEFKQGTLPEGITDLGYTHKPSAAKPVEAKPEEPLVQASAEAIKDETVDKTTDATVKTPTAGKVTGSALSSKMLEKWAVEILKELRAINKKLDGGTGETPAEVTSSEPTAPTAEALMKAIPGLKREDAEKIIAKSVKPKTDEPVQATVEEPTPAQVVAEETPKTKEQQTRHSKRSASGKFVSSIEPPPPEGKYDYLDYEDDSPRMESMRRSGTGQGKIKRKDIEQQRNRRKSAKKRTQVRNQMRENKATMEQEVQPTQAVFQEYQAPLAPIEPPAQATATQSKSSGSVEQTNPEVPELKEIDRDIEILTETVSGSAGGGVIPSFGGSLLSKAGGAIRGAAGAASGALAVGGTAVGGLAAGFGAGELINKAMGQQTATQTLMEHGEATQMMADVEEAKKQGTAEREAVAKKHGFNTFEEFQAANRKKMMQKQAAPVEAQAQQKKEGTDTVFTLDRRETGNGFEEKMGGMVLKPGSKYQPKERPDPFGTAEKYFESQGAKAPAPTVINNYNQAAPPPPQAAPPVSVFIRPVHPSMMRYQEKRLTRILNPQSSV